MSRWLLRNNYAVIKLSANYRLLLPIGYFFAVTYAHSDDGSHKYEGIETGADKQKLSI